MRRVVVKDFAIGEGEPLCILSGPCVIESEEHCLKAAETLKSLFSKTSIHLIFKSSYDKANRSSINGFRGVGLEKGLRILERVQKEFDLPVVTDVHSPEEAKAAGQVCDLIQVPAFLCRQTDLVLAAGKTGKVVTVKKGQFLAPWDMKNVIDKILSTGNNRIIPTERGVSFGYNNLVSDFRAIPIMQKWGFPVCYDATHSVQLPGGHGTATSGEREFVPILSKAAIAVGAECLFMESHPNPNEAKSDKDAVVPFEELPALLRDLEALYAAVHR